MPRRSRSRSPRRRNSRERDYDCRRNHSRSRKDSRKDDYPAHDDRRKRYGGEEYDEPNRYEGRRHNEGRSRHDRSPRSERDREQGGERRRPERNRSRSRSPRRRSSRGESSRPRSKSKSPAVEDKSKPNFKPSGLLAAATNTVQLSDGTKTVLKYNEPPEARKPQSGWRLYVFKGNEQTDVLHIHRQSAYLIGRDKAVVDIFVEHPSCSKQHAAIQFRQVQEKDEFGSSKAVVKPFIVDLESTNGTHVNDEAIPTSRYYELRASDVIKFGQSTREYVLLHDEV